MQRPRSAENEANFRLHICRKRRPPPPKLPFTDAVVYFLVLSCPKKSYIHKFPKLNVDCPTHVVVVVFFCVLGLLLCRKFWSWCWWEEEEEEEEEEAEDQKKTYLLYRQKNLNTSTKKKVGASSTPTTNNKKVMRMTKIYTHFFSPCGHVGCSQRCAYFIILGMIMYCTNVTC